METRTRAGSAVLVDEPLSAQAEFYSSSFLKRAAIPRGNALMINLRSEWYEGQLLGLIRREAISCLMKEGGIDCSAEETFLKGSPVLNDIVAGRLQEVADSYSCCERSAVQTVCLYSRMSSTGWYCLRMAA